MSVQRQAVLPREAVTFLQAVRGQVGAFGENEDLGGEETAQ